ncbi:F-type H+-transporting ATPase subunit b [Limimonas halophila]|uniref:ATP synthase subunit b n=1 Tax=Limimonas halophila TaxID=1082479 RepID=A0A1G7KYA6_9PROT|nr:hypothetical protein [Limimonas halophila]SDF42076.1 F-type H+-transporting ATPase subunit b [Limimonas halophila]
MPQFNPEWFASQIFWLVISFTLLYLLMSRIALPRMQEIVEGREHKIQEDLNKAESLRDEAREINQAYEEQLREARGEAQKLLRETSEAISKEHAERHAEFGKELEQKVQEAEERIERAKAEALENVEDVAAGLAQDATSRLIGSNVGDAHAKKAVQSSVERAG